MNTDEFVKIISPYCDSEEDIKGICVNVDDAESRGAMVDFIRIAKRVGYEINADRLVVLSVLLMNEKAKREKESASNGEG